MAEVELGGSAQADPRLGSSKPLSRLEQMQANLHRKLLQEKEDKLIKLCNDSQEKTVPPTRSKSGNSSLSQTSGGSVRKFFEERRAMENMNLENSMTSLDSYFLNASNGLIARNNLKNSSSAPQRPKKGSPIGWDKSYPLLPIERTNSGSSSGYESITSQSKSFSTASEPKHRVPHVRRQSLDRYKSKEEPANMRRSKSQILNGTLAKDETLKSQKGQSSPNRAKSTAVKENRFARDEEKRKMQQEMRRREQELINKIKEQQAEIERMRQEKIKEEKAQKARLYRKSYPTNQQGKGIPQSDSLPSFTSIGSAKPNVLASSESKSSSGNISSTSSKRISPVHAASPPAPLTKEVSKPVRNSSNSDLPECDVCGRRFAADRIEKHRSVCKKTNSKKRKVFDPIKMRTRGTEQESFVKNKKNVPEVKPKKSNWRQKHENFLQTIRQAKVLQDHLNSGGKLSDLPPPPPLDTSDYVQCPHCGRKFNEAAAERHIPKCQSIRSNKK